MKNFLISFFFLAIFFGTNVFAIAEESSRETYVVVLPGYFYISVHGALQEGVSLSGLRPADGVTSQLGYWNSNKNFDYLEYYDSSSVDGFRIQMYLSSDFIYTGTHSDQQNIPVSRFKVFADYDKDNNIGKAPSVGVDDFFSTLNINGEKSCKSDEILDYDDFYDFNSEFFLDDKAYPFDYDPFNYLLSRNACPNEGKIYIGRFELDLGVVKAGEYKTSLYIIMLDGY